MTYTPEQLREWAEHKTCRPSGSVYSCPCLLAGTVALSDQLRAHAAALERLAERDAENAVLRDAINDALPWMIKLGDYIGNGTQADPMGRCNAILKMRIAVEKRDD